MKIEIYKEQDIPMFSVDGELFAYDDYLIRDIVSSNLKIRGYY